MHLLTSRYVSDLCRQMHAVKFAPLLPKAEPIAPVVSTLTFPFANFATCEALEAKLPSNKNGSSEHIRRVARTLYLYSVCRDIRLEDVIEVYRPAVERLRQFDLVGLSSPTGVAAMLDISRSIVRAHTVEGVVQVGPNPSGVMDAQTVRDSYHNSILVQLSDAEKSLVTAVTGTVQCDDSALRSFILLPRGERELRLQNAISAMWTETTSWGDCKVSILTAQEAKDSIYRKFGFVKPTKEEMNAMLSTNAFNDALLTTGQIEILDMANRHGRSLDASIFEAPTHFWGWYGGCMDGRSDADFPQSQKVPRTLVAARLASATCFKGSNITDYRPFMAAVTNGDLRIIRFDPGSPMESVGSSEFANILSHPSLSGEYAETIFSVCASDDSLTLRQAARVESEFRTLLEFLGHECPAPQVSFSTLSSVPKREKDGINYRKKNDDSSSLVTIQTTDGQIKLMAVFDGMGGHADGAFASSIAKETFEVAALAGWVSSPEDVRMVTMLAHLEIVRQQILVKQPLPPVRAQANDMGTTMSVTFIQNDDFYGIHAGDSDWMVIRNGEAVYQSEGHDQVFARLDQHRNELAKQWKAQGRDTSDPEFEAEAQRLTQADVAILGTTIQKNVISSAPGVFLSYLQINNQHKSAVPFMLQKGDIIAVMSDGIGVPVCPHEIARVVAKHSGNTRAAEQEIISLAEIRPKSIMNPVTCQCGQRQGKQDDDKTIGIHVHE